MTRLGRILKWLLLVPLLLVVALLAIANDHHVTMNFNPFNPADQVLQIDLALYQFGFGAFIVGALVGAFIVWNNQRKYRRKARDNRYEAARWQAKAERAERPDPKTGQLPAPPGLAGPGHAA